MDERILIHSFMDECILAQWLMYLLAVNYGLCDMWRAGNYTVLRAANYTVLRAENYLKSWELYSLRSWELYSLKIWELYSLKSWELYSLNCSAFAALVWLFGMMPAS